MNKIIIHDSYKVRRAELKVFYNIQLYFTLHSTLKNKTNIFNTHKQLHHFQLYLIVLITV